MLIRTFVWLLVVLLTMGQHATLLASTVITSGSIIRYLRCQGRPSDRGARCRLASWLPGT